MQVVPAGPGTCILNEAALTGRESRRDDSSFLSPAAFLLHLKLRKTCASCAK